MAKKIKPCERNLILALKACAKAHNANFCHWRYVGQVGIEKDTIPVQADMGAIISAFVQPKYADIYTPCGFGHTIAYLYTNEDFYRNEVDEMTLSMALPYGTMEKIRWTRV